MGTYRQHYQIVHDTVLDPIILLFAFLGALINTNSPDLYCAKYDKHSSRQWLFKKHLKVLHSLEYENFVHLDVTIDIDRSSFYYTKCNKHFSSKDSFNNHSEFIYNSMNPHVEKMKIIMLIGCIKSVQCRSYSFHFACNKLSYMPLC